MRTFQSTDAVDRSYYPEDFRDEIAAYKGAVGSPCKYVPSEFEHPDYYVLKGRRLDYYLWWRAATERGISAETDPGYVWLRCTELINSDDDPSDVARSFSLVLDSVRATGSTILWGEFRQMVQAYSAANGLYETGLPGDVPDEEAMLFWNDSHAVTWKLTRYPIQAPTADWWEEGHYDWSPAGISASCMRDILMRSLEGIDEYCRSSRGMGFLRHTVDRWFTRVIDPFLGTSRFEPSECVRIPEVQLYEGPFFVLINSILKQVTALLRRDGRKTVLPRTFPDEYRAIVASAVDAVMHGGPWDPKSFRVGDGGFWEDDGLEASPPRRGGKALIRNDPRSRNKCIDPREEDFEVLWSEDSDDPRKYVQSGQWRPLPSDMSPEQRAFYVYWRTMARRGTFLDTDRGYVWLFCSELVNHDDDPLAVQDLLDRAFHAYDVNGSFINVIAEAACDHALKHNLDPPIADADAELSVAFMKIRANPIGAILPRIGCRLASWDFDEYLGYDYDLYTVLFTAAYRAMDDHYKRTRRIRLAGLIGNLCDSTMDICLYPSLWCPEDSIIELRRPTSVSTSFRTVAEGIARTVVRTMNGRLGGPMPGAMMWFSAEEERIVEEAVLRILDGMDARSRMEKALIMASRVALDMGAVRSAADDLAAVTGMMAVEDAEDVRDEPSQEKASGWDALLASLDDVERAYIRGGKPSLKGTGRRSVEVEASVNRKAMDSMGDTLMNDGAVLPDYYEDVRRLFE